MYVMTNRKDVGCIHEINPMGQRRIIPVDYKPINESDDQDFKPDIEWYLNNGYTRIEDVKKALGKIANGHC